MMSRSTFILLTATTLLSLIAVQSADAYRRLIYDCSKPTSSNTCWWGLDPDDANYPTQYAPYVFGRLEGEPPRGPNPVPGITFGSIDVDTAYDWVPLLHDYYADKFGRNGVNRQGGLSDGGFWQVTDYPVRVNFNGTNPLTCEQTSASFQWGNPSVVVSFCCGALQPDAFGHEMAHGIWHYDVNGGNTSYEQGALNESFADIFGEAFELHLTGHTDWLMLEKDGTTVIHNLANPGTETYLAAGQHIPYPDRYLSPNFFTGSGDNGGVHVNSTVVSHAAYLASEGGTFNGFDITGIGFDKVEQIWYRAVTEYFTANENFNSAYTRLIQAANDLYGPDDVWELTKALRAAEMNMSRSFNGDFNSDGVVNAADYVVWRKGLGTLYSQGVFDRWRANFGPASGNGSGSSTNVGVPEPSSVAMLILAVTSLCFQRRRPIF